MTDAWDDIASEQIVSPRKARMRAAEKRKQKALQERNHLFREWQKWHKERKDELLGGPWGEPARELADYLERMTPEDASALVSMVEHGPWREADADTRFLVLALIDHSVIYLRENNGLEPFDDPLDDEPSAFLIIKELLR
jgi:hypothetical protein